MSKVMVVEDSPTQALRTRIALESQGFTVTIVADPTEAIDAAKDDRPDVVLSDVRMPGMDGFELLQAIQADADLAGIPVVLASATVNSQEDRDFALEHGAKDYIEKGLVPNALADVLNAAIG